jgi:ABC-type phosphate/phosphonate transport system substrate-binding protein
MKRSSRIAVALVTAAVFLLTPLAALAADTIFCWFPPSWGSKGSAARAITESLSTNSGLDVKPRIAKSYPEILAAFSSDKPSLVYVGSFVQAIINARKIGTPLVQNVNGKELYSGVLVYPKGGDPAAILKDSPDQIAFASGASSGESSAKAATGGKAAVAVKNHGAACKAVEAGKAKAAVVKNWWWDGNKDKFPNFEMYEIPGVSVTKNPDNVLTASKAVSAGDMKKLTDAAVASKDVFGAQEMAPFDAANLAFTLELMEKGKIDPLTYAW